MDVATIAFLILLRGTPTEHVIVVPSMDDCHRTAESLANFECLTADEFDERTRAGGATSDLQPASGPNNPVAMPSGTPEIKPMDGAPSALKRQIRRSLAPQPEPRTAYPSKRGTNEQGNARIVLAASR